MTISEKNKYIFIAVPKTGSTTIAMFLKANDKSYSKNKIESGQSIINTETHIGYAELEEKLGDRINEYVTFAFIRDPYQKLFSYYRYAIRPKDQFRYKFGIKGWITRNLSFLLGFKLWALSFPYKLSADFITDKNGNIGVKYLGRTENLNNDFEAICKLENYDFLAQIDNMPRMRETIPLDLSMHLSVPWFKKLIDKRLKKDLEIYNLVGNKLYINPKLTK